jgi:hypothetical protein
MSFESCLQYRYAVLEQWRENPMAKHGFESVDQYIALQPEAAQGILRSIRHSIRKAVPNAQEGISYKMPAYTVGCDPLLQFALWNRQGRLDAILNLAVDVHLPSILDQLPDLPLGRRG